MILMLGMLTNHYSSSYFQVETNLIRPSGNFFDIAAMQCIHNICSRTVSLLASVVCFAELVQNWFISHLGRATCTVHSVSGKTSNIFRNHQFKTSANFHKFWTPIPLPSTGFLILSFGKFGKFLTPPP